MPFGQELVHYAIGIASCGVPGLPAGLGALWAAHGRLPWSRLVEPAMRLAVEGVAMPAAHASCLQMLATVMTMNEGARIYSPGGSILEEGDVLHQPGLVHALEAMADEGVATFYSGTIAEALLELMDERLGLVTREDLASYEARWSDPVELEFRGHAVRTRAGLGDFPGALANLPHLRGLDEPTRVLALVEALAGPAAGTGTTNLAVLDADGNACVLTTSLGLGSGDFLPGFDLHLNSMLGEADLVQEPLQPGDRMASMMSPVIALADGDVRARRRRGGRDTPAERAPAGRGGRARRTARFAGGRRPVPRPSGRLGGSARAGLQRGNAGSARVSRLRGSCLAGTAPLLRRCERRHADRRRGGSAEKRRCASPSLRTGLSARTHPTYPHSGQPGFACTVPPPRGLA